MDSSEAYNKIVSRYTELSSERDAYIKRAANYAKYTLPYVFRDATITETAYNALERGFDGTGATCVNSLSNKIVKTIFPTNIPFFKLETNPAIASLVTKEDVSAAEKQYTILEKKVSKDFAKLSPAHDLVFTTKLLIVTGNALFYLGDDGATTYNLNDYVVYRNKMGGVLELIIKEKKSYKSLKTSDKESLSDTIGICGDDDRLLDLYTSIIFNPDDETYYVSQYLEGVEVFSDEKYSKDALPYVVLAWELVKGEHYGRGLVEQYAGSFACIYALSQSNTTLAAALSRIIWLVRPGSKLSNQIASLMSNPNQQVYSGAEGDLSMLSINKAADAQFSSAIKQEQVQLVKEAFLVTSSIQRDAERVTKYELSLMAAELESAFGGVYSSISSSWQKPVANRLLTPYLAEQMKSGLVDFTITTGLSSISRADELTNLSGFFNSLAQLQNVPEMALASLDMDKVIQLVAQGNNLDMSEDKSVLKSTEQIQAEQQQQQEANVNNVATQAMLKQ